VSDHVEDALYQELRTTAAVYNLIGGSGDSAKLYDEWVPQNVALEYVWFERDSNPKHNRLSGQSGLDEANFTFYVVASTRAKRKDLADALSSALRALRQKTVQSVWFHGVLQTDERDSVISEGDGSQGKRYVTEQDYTVFSAR